MSRSFKAALTELKRTGEGSVTRQICELVAEAIASGELRPGAQLPPTRELARLAGINQLTAVRAYQRLRERGLVTACVGRGTFVRESALGTQSVENGSTDWQVYALPERLETAQNRMVAELQRDSGAPGTIPLSVGHLATDLLPAKAFRAAIDRVFEEVGPHALQYAQAAGEPVLREALVRHVGRTGASESPGNVLVTSGARQALSLIARALIRPGDVAACESPSFVGSISALHAAGARVLPVPVDDRGLDVDALARLTQRHDVKLVFLQSRVQNPSGASLGPKRSESLIELARRHAFFIVDDEVWAELSSDGANRPGLRAWDQGHVISVGSFAKVLGGGLRLGWALASGPILDRLVVEKQNDDTHTNLVTQLAVADLLDSGHLARHLKQIRTALAVRGEALVRTIERHLATVATWTDPHGANLWMTLKEPLDEQRLYAEAIRQGVTFVPGSAMILDRPHRTHLRLSYGYVAAEELELGVERLARAIDTVQRTEQPRTIPVA